MAFNNTTKSQQVSINLAAMVGNRVQAVIETQKRERAKSEAQFQQTVIDQGLSYEAQIEFRKQQIENENKKTAPDSVYITTLEGSVKDLRKLNRYKQIREDYLTKYEDLKSGKLNLQQMAGFLQDQLDNAPDEEARAEIRKELSDNRVAISDSEVNVLKNRVLLAQKDGTIDTLNGTIDDLAKRKAFADLNGNAEESSAWDVSLTSLRKQLNEVKVSNTLHDIDLKVSRTASSAIQKLDMLNSEISGAEGNSPITVNGVAYKSAKEFWTSQRDNYIAGSGAIDGFKNFFGDIESDVKSKIDTVSKINKFGFVPLPTLDAINQDYTILATRPEFVNQGDKLVASKTAALSYGVDKSANALIDSSVDTLQLNSGSQALDSLQSKYGIDTTTYKSQLNQKIIQKGAELPSIKKAADQLKTVGAETPATTVPDSNTPKEVLKQNNQPPEIIPKTETPPATPAGGAPEASPSAVAPAPVPAAPVAPQFKEYTIKAGDTLSGIAQSQLGDAKRFKDLATANNIKDPNKIIAGAKIKIPV